MFEEAKQVEETQDAGDTLGKTREALPSMRKAQAGDSVQLGMQAGRIEIRLKEFPDVRGIRGCNCWRREIPSHTTGCLAGLDFVLPSFPLTFWVRFRPDCFFSWSLSINLGNLKELVIHFKLLLITKAMSAPINTTNKL